MFRQAINAIQGATLNAASKSPILSQRRGIHKVELLQIHDIVHRPAAEPLRVHGLNLHDSKKAIDASPATPSEKAHDPAMLTASTTSHTQDVSLDQA